MSLPVFLLILRIISSILLIGLTLALAWLIYRDIALAGDTLAAAERPSGLLRVVANDEAGGPAPDTVFPLLPVTSIGRGAGNTVVLPDGFASAEHALITRRSGQWWLQDQGSRNGTLLNQVPVRDTAVISAGDIIAIGGTQLKVEF